MRYVLVADDHQVTRRGVREILRDAFEGVEVLEADGAESVFAQLNARPWDLILLDILMPGANVLDILTQIRAEHPTVPVLVLTALTETAYVVQTLRAGANGFIQKHRAVDDLLEAIRQVSAGGTYLHSESASAVALALREPTATEPHQSLSPRELEIFRLIALGRAIKEIAGDLSLSDKTVATYLARIREKTGLQSHVDIARYALLHGLVK